MKNEQKSYLGTGWAFPPAFIKNAGVEMVSDQDDILQSLRILFSTTVGERVFRFDYGSNIRQFVFEEMNLSVENLIIDHIKQTVLFFEPRVKVTDVSVETKDSQEGILWINIEYTILRTNSRSNMVYPFYFLEGTNL